MYANHARWRWMRCGLLLAVVVLTLVPLVAHAKPLVTPRVVGYTAHQVQPDDTLATIAAAHGSDPLLLQSYNRLQAAPQVGQPLIVPRLAGQAATVPPTAPPLVLRGNPDRPMVALTLDAGAGSAPTPAILQAFRERGLRTTFFVTGEWMQKNPALTRQIVADGHELANHSLTHPDFTTLSPARQRYELRQTERIAQRIAGVSTRPYFRPPFGAYDQTVLQTVVAEGYLPIYWSLDSLDSVGEPKTPEFLFERITATLPPNELPGAIILAHCGSEGTAAAMPAILDRFAAMGLQVRPLSDVLHSRPTTPPVAP